MTPPQLSPIGPQFALAAAHDVGLQELEPSDDPASAGENVPDGGAIEPASSASAPGGANSLSPPEPHAMATAPTAPATNRERKPLRMDETPEG
jgi:hypothetical protein